MTIVENATRARDIAFYAFRLQPSDQILTTHDEYASSNMPAGTVRFHVAGEIEADDYEDVLVPALHRARGRRRPAHALRDR